MHPPTDETSTNKRSPTDETILKRHENYDLISADNFEGTRPYDRAGEEVGGADGTMIDKRSGKVVYAAISFGGVFGIASTLRAGPWSVLDYDVECKGHMVDVDAGKRKGAPEYECEGHRADRKWCVQVHDYGGVPPYRM